MNEEAPSRAGSRLLGIALFIIGLATVSLAQGIPAQGLGNNHDPGPAAFPTALGLFLIIGGIREWLIYVRDWHLARKASAVTVPQSAEMAELPVSQRALLWAALVVYIPTMFLVGFGLSTFLLMLCVLRQLESSWRMAILSAGGFLITIYLLFVLGFRVQLPRGVLDLPF